MMHVGRFRYLVVLLFLFNSSCASDAALTNWSFKPPQGWTLLKRPPFPLTPPMQIWGHYGQSISLAEISPRMYRSIGDGALSTTAFPITLCHNREASFLRKRPGSGEHFADGVKMRSGNSYVLVWYIYPSFATPDPAAEAALKSICPRE